MNIIWIILGSIVLAILYLTSIERIPFAMAKRKICPKCHNKLVPPRIDFFEWQNEYVRQEKVEKNGIEDTYVCIVCCHCGHLVPQKKAPTFD